MNEHGKNLAADGLSPTRKPPSLTHKGCHSGSLTNQRLRRRQHSMAQHYYCLSCVRSSAFPVRGTYLPTYHTIPYRSFPCFNNVTGVICRSTVLESARDLPTTHFQRQNDDNAVAVDRRRPPNDALAAGTALAIHYSTPGNRMSL